MWWVMLMVHIEGHRAKFAVSLTRDDYARLERFAKACGKSPAVAARDLLVDLLIDDEAAHSENECCRISR